MLRALLWWLFAFFPGVARAESSETLDLTDHWVGLNALAIFALAYLLVMSEAFTHLANPNR